MPALEALILFNPEFSSIYGITVLTAESPIKYIQLISLNEKEKLPKTLSNTKKYDRMESKNNQKVPKVKDQNVDTK